MTGYLQTKFALIRKTSYMVAIYEEKSFHFIDVSRDDEVIAWQFPLRIGHI